MWGKGEKMGAAREVAKRTSFETTSLLLAALTLAATLAWKDVVTNVAHRAVQDYRRKNPAAMQTNERDEDAAGHDKTSGCSDVFADIIVATALTLFFGGAVAARCCFSK